MLGVGAELATPENCQLTFAFPAILKADLDRYTVMHAQSHGEAVAAVTVIPPTALPSIPPRSAHVTSS